jgi:FkbM family methyltransferase
LFSQFGQDEYVLELFGGARHGFFLDSGAADGIGASNTYILEHSFEWDGICIEPNSQFFAELIKNRRCKCLNCCLYDRDDEVEFFEDALTLGGIVDEYHPALLQQAKNMLCLPPIASGKLNTVRKKTRTVRDVLRACSAPQTIDYWSLDTEGSELTILKSFPFDEYSFRVLTVEHNRFPIREQIKQFLEFHGYRRVRAFEIDDCYVRDEQSFATFWRSSAWRRGAV